MIPGDDQRVESVLYTPGNMFPPRIREATNSVSVLFDSKFISNNAIYIYSTIACVVFIAVLYACFAYALFNQAAALAISIIVGIISSFALKANLAYNWHDHARSWAVNGQRVTWSYGDSLYGEVDLDDCGPVCIRYGCCETGSIGLTASVIALCHEKVPAKAWICLGISYVKNYDARDAEEAIKNLVELAPGTSIMFNYNGVRCKILSEDKFWRIL